MDGSGILAGMRDRREPRRHDAKLPAFVRLSTTISSVLGTRDTVGSIFPGHPCSCSRAPRAFNIGNAGWEHVIAVNQVGQRFYNESAIGDISEATPNIRRGRDGTRKPFVPLDWRNASTEQVKAQYTRSAAADAALAMNEGSRAPDYASGPVWAIFDAAAVKRRQMADPLSLYRRTARRVLPPRPIRWPSLRRK